MSQGIVNVYRINFGKKGRTIKNPELSHPPHIWSHVLDSARVNSKCHHRKPKKQIMDFDFIHFVIFVIQIIKKALTMGSFHE